MNDPVNISVRENEKLNTMIITAQVYFTSEIQIPKDDYENLSIRSFTEANLKDTLWRFVRYCAFENFPLESRY